MITSSQSQNQSQKAALLISLVFSLALFSSLLVTPVRAAGPLDQIGSVFSRLKNKTQQTFLRIIPGNKSGQAVMQQSLAAFQDVRSLTFESNLEISAQEQGQAVGKAVLNISGPTQITNLYDPQTTDQQLNINGQIEQDGTTSTANVDLIMTDQNLYLKVNEVPTMQLFDVSSFQGQWLRFDSSMGMLPGAGMAEADQETATLTADQTKQMAQAVQQLVADADISQAKKEVQAGQSVFVVEVTLPDEAIIDFTRRTNQISGQLANQELADQQLTNLKTSLEKIEPLKLTFWINQKTFYPVHLETNLKPVVNQNGPQLSGSPLAAFNPLGNQPTELEVKLSLDLAEFNQPFEIQAPANATDGQAAFQKLLGGPAMFQGMEGMMEGMETGELPTMPTEMTNDGNTTGVPELPTLTDEQLQLLEKYGY